MAGAASPPHHSPATSAESIDLAPISLRGPTRARLANPEGVVGLTLRRRRAVVGVALQGDGSTDTLVDCSLDHDDPPSAMEVRLDPVSDRHLSGRLGGLAVDVDVPASAGGGRLAPRLGEANGVEPLIDAHDVDDIQSAASRSSPALRDRMIEPNSGRLTPWTIGEERGSVRSAFASSPGTWPFSHSR